MKIYNTEKIEVHYFQMADIWQRFCELHSSLYDLTCEEYSLLLDSNIDDLDEVIEKKQSVIKEISLLESLRSELIEKVNLLIDDPWKISSVSDLLSYFREYELERNQNYLKNFNKLLLSLIECFHSLMIPSQLT